MSDHPGIHFGATGVERLPGEAHDAWVDRTAEFYGEQTLAQARKMADLGVSNGEALAGVRGQGRLRRMRN